MCRNFLPFIFMRECPEIGINKFSQEYNYRVIEYIEKGIVHKLCGND